MLIKRELWKDEVWKMRREGGVLSAQADRCVLLGLLADSARPIQASQPPIVDQEACTVAAQPW